mgnify:CR=1 FL=1
MSQLHRQPLLSVFARCSYVTPHVEPEDRAQHHLDCICTWLDVSLDLKIGLCENWRLEAQTAWLLGWLDFRVATIILLLGFVFEATVVTIICRWHRRRVADL